MNFAIFRPNVDEILPEFHEELQQIIKVYNILIENVRTVLKMQEISGIYENSHFSEWNFQSAPYLLPVQHALAQRAPEGVVRGLLTSHPKSAGQVRDKFILGLTTQAYGVD